MNWKDFIEQLLKDFRTSSYEIQKKFGINSAIISNLRNGKNNPSQATIKALEDAFSIKIHDEDIDNIYYTTRSLPTFEEKNNYHDTETIDSKNVFNKFPLIAMSNAPLNHIPKDAVLDYIIFPYPLKEGCYAMKINSDNMGSVIKNGDIALIDPGLEIVNGSTVFCRLISGEHHIKFFRKITTNLVQLYSENPNIEPIIIDMSQIETLHKVVVSYHYH
jgi:phage repressor protein C with HTH and peptisase S24 domain